MVPDIACFALFLAHDHESVKKYIYIFLLCEIKIADTASLVIDSLAYPYQEMWIKFEDNSYCLVLQILP